MVVEEIDAFDDAMPVWEWKFRGGPYNVVPT